MSDDNHKTEVWSCAWCRGRYCIAVQRLPISGDVISTRIPGRWWSSPERWPWVDLAWRAENNRYYCGDECMRAAAVSRATVPT